VLKTKSLQIDEIDGWSDEQREAFNESCKKIINATKELNASALAYAKAVGGLRKSIMRLGVIEDWPMKNCLFTIDLDGETMYVKVINYSYATCTIDTQVVDSNKKPLYIRTFDEDQISDKMLKCFRMQVL
jgi:hypothetical protein